ncbi:MAG TPA: alpha/beta hydrolase family protein [Acidimicrobiales bacterium]
MGRHAAGPSQWLRRIGVLSAVAVVALTLPGGPAGADTGAHHHHHRSGLVDFAGIRVQQVERVDSRLMDVTMVTGALAAPVHVEVLLPSDYADAPGQRYPSLYLLHGCNAGNDPNGPFNGSDYLAWAQAGQAEQTSADAGVIVVIPEGGSAASSTDWFNGGAGGPPEWETFQVDQLVPWIDHNFRTIDSRGERAIAGLSMGGFGSLSYAARHPDLFGAAASFSGADDLTDPPAVAEPISTVVVAACAAGEGGSGFSTFGPHATEELNWRAHDPPQLAANLAHTKLYLYTGNGQPGPLDPPGTTGVDTIEALAHEATVQFHDVLESAGIHSFFDDYGPGTHTFPYWARDLRDVLPKLMAEFARNRGDPTTFTFTSEAASYAAYGWDVHMHRLAGEFSTLADAHARSFTLSGSGSAVVVTGPDYPPLSAQQIQVRSRSGTRSTTLRADEEGRLRIPVPLGPANPFQEYTAAALTAGTQVFVTVVEVRPPR